MLTASQMVLIDTISIKNGEINWYQLGRSVLHLLDSPADFVIDMRFLVDGGYIEERLVGDGALPKLFLTENGWLKISQGK